MYQRPLRALSTDWQTHYASSWWLPTTNHQPPTTDYVPLPQIKIPARRAGQESGADHVDGPAHAGGRRRLVRQLGLRRRGDALRQPFAQDRRRRRLCAILYSARIFFNQRRALGRREPVVAGAQAFDRDLSASRRAAVVVDGGAPGARFAGGAGAIERESGREAARRLSRTIPGRGPGDRPKSEPPRRREFWRGSVAASIAGAGRFAGADLSRRDAYRPPE